MFVSDPKDLNDLNDQNNWITGLQEAPQTIDRMVYFILESSHVHTLQFALLMKTIGNRYLVSQNTFDPNIMKNLM